MSTRDRADQHLDDLAVLRRDLHRFPELAFEEHRTAAVIAAELRRLGLEVLTGIGKTGVVGKLTTGSSRRAFAFRADMDALPMQELNSFEHRSTESGKFHGCGHDGHTTMLLGAARRLAAAPNFDGTLYFVFQPAEEAAGGALAMLNDGLFEKCPLAAVFGMHNWPGLEAGHFSIRSGAMMAALGIFDLHIKGIGGHGALPHRCVDPVVIAAEIIQSLQTVVSRNVDPLKAAVVSITKIQAGTAYNVIPEHVHLGGSVRYFDSAVGELIGRRIAEIAQHVSAAHGAQVEVNYSERYPTLVNAPAETEYAVAAAESLVGPAHVQRAGDAIMGSEDFAFMLRAKPGAYILVGNGASSPQCHHPEYDFNDEIIPLGVSYWVELARMLMPRSVA